MDADASGREQGGATREPEGGVDAGQSTNPTTEPERPDAGAQADTGPVATEPERPDAGAQDTGPDAAGTHATDHPVDPFGYAVVGRNVYPPLYERVEAVACENLAPLPSQCSSDADCGTGFACLCGVLQGFGGVLAGLCIPAECRSAADCGGDRCLLSVGNRGNDCCTFGRLGFFCSRRASTCHGGGDCAGNGIACMYDDALDGFKCKPFGCSCN